MNLTLNVPEIGQLADAILKLAEALRSAPLPAPQATVLSSTPLPVHLPAVLSSTLKLAAADNPAAGAPGHVPLVPDTPLALTPVASTADNPAAVFGSAAAPTPLAPAAPSTAVAAVAPTVPAAPAVSAPTPPTASLAPVLPGVPVAHAPLVPAAPTSPAAAAGTDRTGLPWDGRIHAANRSTNQDGTWRRRRGVEDAEVVRVEAELRQAVAANAAVAVAAPLAPTPVAAPAAAPAPQPIIAPPPAAAAAPSAITFGQLAMKIEGPILNKTLSWDALNLVLGKHGLTTFNQLMQAPAIVPLIDAEISASLGIAAGV